MSLIGIIITIAIAGFIVWIILQVPMPAPFRSVIIGVAVLVLILWLLQLTGIYTGFSDVKIR